MTSTWGKKEQDLTRKIIHTVDVVAFLVQTDSPKKGCRVIHLDGINGYITMDDALNFCYRIYDHHTDQVIAQFSTVEELIDGGWRVVEHGKSSIWAPLKTLSLSLPTLLSHYCVMTNVAKK